MPDPAPAASATDNGGAKTDPTDPATSATAPADPASTDTVEFWKAKAREQEKRAKDNAAAATKLAELEDAQKSETQKLTDAKTAAEADAADARADALRWKIAAKFGVSDDDAETFLTGTDEDTLTRQAERLATLAKTDGNVPGPRPDLSQGARSGEPQGGEPAQQFANFLKGQLQK